MNLARRLALAGLALAGAGSVSVAEQLQPFQMVRSLQLVQDRIASGDHAALPMQKKLLEMIDERFRGADRQTLEDPRNFRAVLVYGMSGGNPATLKRALAKLPPEAEGKAMADGIMSYLNGQPKAAQVKLAGTDPLALAPEIGAFVALIRGASLALENPQAAIPLFDQARLLGPGTLVEEAALRRTIDLAPALGDAERFLRASDQYVRRYLRSPYASQFADSFVSGVLAFHASLKQEQLADITTLMDPEQEKVIYLRIARRAAIDGMLELSEFASAVAEGKVDPSRGDPRAVLYSSLATVTSGNVEEVIAKLDGIDRSRLSPGDRDLLDAVRKIANDVIEPANENVQPETAAAATAAAEPAAPEGHSGDQPVPAEAEPVLAEESEALPATDAAAVEQPPPVVVEEKIEPGSPEATLADARQKLQAVDALLEEFP